MLEEALDLGSGSGEPFPPSIPPAEPPPLLPPAPIPSPSAEDGGIFWTAISFFAMLLTLAAVVCGVGEVRRRRLNRQRADAEYLLHTTTRQGDDEVVRDYAPHNDM